MSAPLLDVRGLTAGYDGAPVLFGVDLAVPDGGILALMGRNGMGKTTTVRAVMGLVRPEGGEVRFAGKALQGAPPFVVARAGIGLVPEGRQIFPTLTVEENLVATAGPPRPGLPAWTLARVYRLFPRLAERRRHFGNRLSGGEQQMLAIGRALMTNPRLMILDEATEGLAPLVRGEIWAAIRALRAEGLSLLLIDKHVDILAGLADQAVVLEKGRVAYRGPAATLAADAELRARLLAV
ncbi:ABC transporter ATP-binding protein [Aquabacter spiritensis]|uniref:Amino acid/amide ABC transporter ATP-binding protein 2 (HAAT family) n=1 Tax=Aquabacter spiritensis TaxID=933073 RepID=A0A4R3LX77_9HYPH|nr:ABC transporter ATP-binding protein [Aquabacter spiritensis]TCT05212.1 amino acid/amide ABC transporter ATP-binding protein 2 (HAAT family) [Aquabacter spiritensis]